MTFMGVPREKIPWYPTVDHKKCEGCGTCVKFCKNGVYELKGNPPHAVVVNPYNCIVACSMCERLCPNTAISFPSMKVITEAIDRYYANLPTKDDFFK